MTIAVDWDIKQQNKQTNKHLELPALYLLTELSNQQSAGFIIILTYIFDPNIFIPYLPCSKTDQRDTRSGVKMCEQDNQVIITLFVFL